MARKVTIRELLVKLGIKADDKSVERFDDGLERVKQHMGDLVRVAAVVTSALTAGAVAMVAQATSTAAHAKEVERQAAALGLTTDAYQELLYAVEKYGVEAQDLADAFGQITGKATEAAAGGEDAAAAFAAIGISVEQLHGTSPEEVFNLIAGGLGKTEDAATRLDIANKLLGEQMARQLLPLLIQGEEGLAKLRGEAHALGVVLSAESIAQAAEFSSQVSVLGTVVTSLRNELGLALIPTLSKLASRFMDWISANREVISQKIDVFAEKVSAAFDAAARAVTAANDAVGGAEGWARLSAILAGLTGAAGVGYVVVKFALLAFAIADTVAAAAAFVGGGTILLVLVVGIGYYLGLMIGWLAEIAGLLLVFEDWITYLQGGDSVIGRLIAKFRDADGLLGALARAAEAMGRVWSAVFNLAGIYVDNLVARLQPAIDFAKALGTAILDYIVRALDMAVPLIDAVAAGLNGLASALGSPAAQQAAATAGRADAGLVEAMASPGLMAARGVDAAASSASFAPLAGGGAASAGRAVNIGGDINISGAGWTEDQVKDVVRSILAERGRMAQEAFRSTEV